MQHDWLQYLETNNAVIENGAVSHFGEMQKEIAVADNGNVMADLSHFALIRFSGEDAQKFLHGQLSNNVEKLDTAHAQYTSYNSPKGRMMASMLLWQDAQGYVMMLPAALREAIQKRLTMFVMRSKVKVSDASDELVRIGIAGRQAAEMIVGAGLALPQDSMGVTVSAHGSAIRLNADRFLLLIKSDAPALWQQLSTRCTPVGAPAWGLLDIRAGIPWITPATQEHFVAQMTNYELIGGVDFKKGCYPGQEIVARTQYLGKLKRRMYHVHAENLADLKAGDEIFSADFEAQASGMVVNAAPSPHGGVEALAVIQIDSAASQTLHAITPDGPTLKLLPLPYAIP